MESDRGRRMPSAWWLRLVLGLLVVPAVWHAWDFPDDIDPEFPKVVRPTFNRRPPPAYRLAEPGDTLDRVAIYLSAGAVVLSLAGLAAARTKRELWPTALAASLGALWHASTPGPTFDGWHGLGWRTIADSSAPIALRLALILAAAGLMGVAGLNFWYQRGRLKDLVASGKALRVNGFLGLGAVLVLARQFEVPGVEPVGYWPRWCLIWGLAAFDLVIARILLARSFSARTLNVLASCSACAGIWVVLVVAGVWTSWYHRPLERLHTVEPGKLYISAMPTYRGLEVAQGRHRFKTIINVFAEDTPLRSPILPDELRFAREHGIRYLNAPPEQSKSDAFLDETLRLAQDPDAWPILVHCHGCMDRSPAWMGIYRFLVQKRPLDDVFREIEAHRGYRPKASVTLLYNRVLRDRAPERYEADPTGRLLIESARGTIDPFYETTKRETEVLRRR